MAGQTLTRNDGDFSFSKLGAGEYQVLVIMAEAQSGEANAPEFGSIEEVFLALEAPLLAYALRLLKEPAMAQDVVQEAFMKLHAEFQSVRDPRRWLRSA